MLYSLEAGYCYRRIVDWVAVDHGPWSSAFSEQEWSAECSSSEQELLFRAGAPAEQHCTAGSFSFTEEEGAASARRVWIGGESRRELQRAGASEQRRRRSTAQHFRAGAQLLIHLL